ncbi:MULTISPECIES: VPLPA-CTERM sorting domain-containing protein [Methylomonas]|uniref:VPLPA-CTERM sorting domain-containing protein n=1 Tax=Methylomonas TaxID=416 RepID=UPI0018D622CB|nr:VPLPA-CTERM sorting domain-containing protein [Methylomonas rhizoryzae]
MFSKRLLAAALFTASPAFASTTFLVDFEKDWDYATGDVDDYYNGGTAADGSGGGADLGVSFVNISGLSNDADFTYYSNAPSMQGTAYAHDTAYMNVAAGVDAALSFYYASPSDVSGAVKAYSGLNGSGELLGSFDLAANSSSAYDSWSMATFNFSGTALSFDFTEAGVNYVALDNVSAVPVPAAAWLLGSGLAMLGVAGRRKAAV